MEHLAAIILDSAIKATVLLALAWMAAYFLKDRSAATRHLLQTFALCAALVLPVLSLFVPAWHLQGMPQLTMEKKPEALPVESTPVAQPFQIESRKAAPVAARQVHRRTITTIPAASAISSQSVQVTHEPASAPVAARNITVSWPQLLLIVWIAGALFLAARFVVAQLRVARLIRKAVPLHDAAWHSCIRAVAQSMGIQRRVELLESRDTDVPLATGTLHPRLVLSPDHHEWSPLRRHAIIQHELAHIKRLDAVTQLLSQLAMAVYWFHPLVWFTVRSMRAERERACDDYVLAAGTKPSEYAHELLEIASSLRHPELTAALAMARRSQLEGRVLALLNPALRRGSVSRKAVLAVAALTLCIVLPLAAIQAAAPRKATTPSGSASAATGSARAGTPAQAPHAEPSKPPEPQAPSTPPPSPDAPSVPGDSEVSSSEIAPPAEPSDQAAASSPAPPAPSRPAIPQEPATPPPQAHNKTFAIGGCTTGGNHSQNIHIEDNDGNKKWNASWAGDDCHVELHAEGEIRFNADATELESISSGGFFEVNERLGANLRQVKVTPSSSGLQYVYKVNGAPQEFDGNARAWFGRFLLSLERTTGFAADTRVPLLLKKGGPQAVLDEISNLQSDYVRGLYFRKLLNQPSLPAPIVNRIISQAGEQIKTDYEMARVLMEVAEKYPMRDEASRTAFLTAANHLKTDYEHSRVLLALLKMPGVSKENIHMALDSAATIKTDYEKSRILVTLAEMKSFDENEITTYLKLVPAIHTDYEKSRSLIALMQSHNISNASVSRILEATSTINTDYEKSRILVALGNMSSFNENQIDSYLNVVGAIKTDYERSRSLLALMERNKLSTAAVIRVVDSISHIQTDYEKSRALTTVARKYPLEGALREKYIAAANTIGSEYERNQALAAVVKHASM